MLFVHYGYRVVVNVNSWHKEFANAVHISTKHKISHNLQLRHSSIVMNGVREVAQYQLAFLHVFQHRARALNAKERRKCEPEI